MIGATLSRTGRPVAFFSRALHVSELRHLSPEKEAHAIVESLRHWRYFLMEKHFEVFADQQAVAFAFNQSGIEANSEYAHVKLDDARQTTVSMRYLAPRGKTTRSDGIKDAEENVQVHPDLNYLQKYEIRHDRTLQTPGSPRKILQHPEDQNQRGALRHPLPSSSITNLTAPHSSTDQESPQPIATQIARTALADDCVIHCPAHPHHHNSNFSTIQSGGCIPQTPR
ncbi:hypothetical protein TNCV_1365861 [Trichonephila clavipes]|nr:hypothetical protein TNCV_1365861 [Trichonephila clavipes]